MASRADVTRGGIWMAEKEMRHVLKPKGRLLVATPRRTHTDRSYGAASYVIIYFIVTAPILSI